MATLVEKRPRKAQEELGDGKPHPGRLMTEEEFVEWCDDKTRAEWVDGEVILMMAGTGRHDDLHFSVKAGMGGLAIKLKSGIVRGDNFQVRLHNPIRRRNPDLLFVSKDRKHILNDKYCDGAPDLVLEIVSQDSLVRDWREKFFDYEKAGVREYWILDPIAKRLEAYELGKDGKYRAIPEVDGKLKSKVLKGFYLRRAWLLRKHFPDALAILKELKIIK